MVLWGKSGRRHACVSSFHIPTTNIQRIHHNWGVNKVCIPLDKRNENKSVWDRSGYLVFDVFHGKQLRTETQGLGQRKILMVIGVFCICNANYIYGRNIHDNNFQGKTTTNGKSKKMENHERMDRFNANDSSDMLYSIHLMNAFER